jgi:hypothetical protein
MKTGLTSVQELNANKAKLPWRGLIATLGIVVVLFLLFTIFGQIPDYNLNESSMKAVPAEAGNPKHYALTVPQQAPSAVGYEATDSVSYEGVGYDRDQVQFTFSEELGESALPVDRKIIKEGSALI